MMITLHATTGKKRVKNNTTTKLDLKLSTIFKEKINNIPQAYGSLFNRNGEYCALGAIVKYLGYDMALEAQSAAASSSSSSSSLTDGTDSIKNHRDKYNNDNDNNKTATDILPPLYSSSSPFESIPLNILEKIERFSHHNSNSISKKHPSCCNRVLENHYDYSLISLLIHLNDYHRMSFAEIGNWLEYKGL
jgi:hypothetical protein